MMKNTLPSLSATLAATLLCSCASTSLKQTWKAPDDPGGPVQKVAVLVVEEQGLVRHGFENRFVAQLEKHGQKALPTYELLTLPQIKESKEAAADRLLESGADSVLIVRLVDKTTYSRQVRETPAAFKPATTGYGSYGWYDYYGIAYADMGVTRSSNWDAFYLDSSLYDLKSGKRRWSALTQTVLKEDTDRLAELDPLAAKVLAALRKAGLIR
jgi:hypothetical protein